MLNIYFPVRYSQKNQQVEFSEENETSSDSESSFEESDSSDLMRTDVDQELIKDFFDHISNDNSSDAVKSPPPKKPKKSRKYPRKPSMRLRNRTKKPVLRDRKNFTHR